MVAHSALTGSDLHEPKGAASATADQVYVANGAGSGTWTHKAQVGLQCAEVTVAHSDLASAASKTLISSSGSQRYKIRHMILIAGTNFSAGGDRNLSITDNTSTWSVIPNATLESLTTSKWGDGTALPFPATIAHMTTASAAGTSIVAKYSGGTTDHNAGSLTLLIFYERTA